MVKVLDIDRVKHSRTLSPATCGMQFSFKVIGTYWIHVGEQAEWTQTIKLLLRGEIYGLFNCFKLFYICCKPIIFIKIFFLPHLYRYDDFYFLTDPENFINSHCPDEAQWQLLDEPIPLDQFERRVLKTSEFYRLGLTLIYPKHFHLVTGELASQNLLNYCVIHPSLCSHLYLCFHRER